MSWVVTAVVVAGVVQASAQTRAYRAQANELLAQKEQEKLSASTREVQRRREINRRLSNAIVGQAASGLTGEGTPSSIALSEARDISTSEAVETLSDRLKQAQLERQAKNVREAGKAAVAGTIFKTALTAYSLGSGGPVGPDHGADAVKLQKSGAVVF